jgi:molecular chaperone Hsp33
MKDALIKVMFEAAPVRAEVVTVDEAWREVCDRHDYPPAVQRMLGELVAASVLLSANLKWNGALVLQMHGHGPVRLAVVECQADLSMRATVKFDSSRTIDADAGLQELLNADGEGKFVIVLDPKDRQPGQQPYQGVVPLRGQTVAEVLEHYMIASEQLHTRLYLAADTERAAGLLLQKLPIEGGHAQNPDEDAWDRAQLLANTVKPEELLQVDPQTLLRRLFWEETLRVFEPQPVTFHCSCTREKVADVLLMLGQADVQELISERGEVLVHCDYCNQAYTFDPVDVTQLFNTGSPHAGILPPGAARH